MDRRKGRDYREKIAQVLLLHFESKAVPDKHNLLASFKIVIRQFRYFSKVSHFLMKLAKAVQAIIPG
jgi:hypothetical protein